MGLADIIWKYIARKVEPYLSSNLKPEADSKVPIASSVMSDVQDTHLAGAVAQINSAREEALQCIAERRTGLEKTVANMAAKEEEFEVHIKRSWKDYKAEMDCRLKEVELSNSQTVAKLILYEAQASKLEEIIQNAELALAALDEKISTEVKKVIDETNAETLKQEIEKLKAANKDFYRSIESKVKMVRADLVKAASDFDEKISKSEKTVSATYSSLQAKLDEVYKSVHSLSYFMGFFEENHPHIVKLMTLSHAEKLLMNELHVKYDGDSEKMMNVLRSEISRLDTRNNHGLDTLAVRAAPKLLQGIIDYQNTHLDKEGEPVSLYRLREQLKAWGKYVSSLQVLKDSLPKEATDAENIKRQE